jgi:cell division protein FtsL
VVAKAVLEKIKKIAKNNAVNVLVFMCFVVSALNTAIFIIFCQQFDFQTQSDII